MRAHSCTVRCAAALTCLWASLACLVDRSLSPLRAVLFSKTGCRDDKNSQGSALPNSSSAVHSVNRLSELSSRFQDLQFQSGPVLYFRGFRTYYFSVLFVMTQICESWRIWLNSGEMGLDLRQYVCYRSQHLDMSSCYELMLSYGKIQLVPVPQPRMTPGDFFVGTACIYIYIYLRCDLNNIFNL